MTHSVIQRREAPEEPLRHSEDAKHPKNLYHPMDGRKDAGAVMKSEQKGECKKRGCGQILSA